MQFIVTERVIRMSKGTVNKRGRERLAKCENDEAKRDNPNAPRLCPHCLFPLPADSKGNALPETCANDVKVGIHKGCYDEQLVMIRDEGKTKTWFLENGLRREDKTPGPQKKTRMAEAS